MEEQIDLVDGAFWGRNPQAELAWLRANAPVWKDPRTGVWGVATYDLVKEVSSRPKLFSNANGIRPDSPATPMMIEMDDPEHLQRRKLVNKGFTPRRVQDQEDSIRRTTQALLDAVEGRKQFDLIWDVAAWIPLIVIGDSLGVEPPDRQQLLEWSDILLKAPGSTNAAVLEAAMDASLGYRDYALKVIGLRREQPTNDLMSVLVSAEVEGVRFDDEEIVMESLLILIGGDETTRHVMSGGAYQLLSDRPQWDELKSDPGLLPSAIEEMLRWVSPIKNMARTAVEDTELGGQHIATGDCLLLLYPSANRDEAIFNEPFKFDIRRAPNLHVAFGFGTHFCLGNSLARLELKVFFQELLGRFPNLELMDATEPTFRPASFVSGYESLPVRAGTS